MKQIDKDILILGLIAYVVGSEGKKFSDFIGKENSYRVADKLEEIFKDNDNLMSNIKELTTTTFDKVKKKL